MRSYHRQGRQTARRWLRWLSAGRVQVDDQRVTRALWAIAAAIVILTAATPAQAHPRIWRDCTPIVGGKRCKDEYGHPWVMCRPGWQPMALSLTCRKLQK